MTDRPSIFASRRAVLGTSVGSIASLAGCSALTSRPAMLDITLFNQTDSPYTVEMSLFRVENDLSRSEARTYSASIDVEPQGEARREGVAESRQYLLRYDLFRDDSTRTDEDHVHVYPTADEEPGNLTFDIRSPGVLARR